MNNLCYEEIAKKLFNDIYNLSFDGVGVTRDSYGEGESCAVKYLIEFAKSQELSVEIDAAANVIFFLDSTMETPSIWMGSHIDSVPEGGNYDGLAGIISGLIILIAQKKESLVFPVPLKVIAFRGEESAWFGKAYIGSKAFLGKLSDHELQLKNRKSNLSLSTCMEASGARIDILKKQQALVNTNNILAYLELHIEQGPILLQKKLPIGIVTGIRGNFRYNSIECYGDAQHSGAIPRELRHDAVFAVSELITLLDRQWEEFLKAGKDLVITSGVMHTDYNDQAVTRIPGHVHFSFEARSLSDKVLDEFNEVFLKKIKYITKKRKVRFSLGEKLTINPAAMDDGLISVLEEQCKYNHIPEIKLASGAGHDAASFANEKIPSAMVFVRNEFGSHNPNEKMEIYDFMIATKLIYTILVNKDLSTIYN